MKKFLILLIIMFVFLIKLDDVKALNYGPYTYDINDISVVGDNLVIRGWGILNSTDGSAQIHNIQPTYKLNLVGEDDNGNVIIQSDDIKDATEDEKAKNRSYTNKNANPNDYTGYYFISNSCSMPYATYGLTSSRSSYASGKALCWNSKVSTDSPNYLYININFKFEIPIAGANSVLKKLKDAGASRVFFKLTMSIRRNPETVYGNSISTVSRTESFNIAIQRNRITGSFEDIGIKSFVDLTDKVTIMVKHPHVQASTNFLQRWYYAKDATSPILIAGTPSNSRPYQMYYRQGDTFTVISQTKENSIDTVYDEKVYYYEVKVQRKSVNGSYDPTDVSNGTSYTAYIPAVWVKPLIVGKGTYFEFETSCSEECDPLTTNCPKSCCSEICSDPANINSEFCKKTCYVAPPNPNQCHYSDALKQYCCLYPNDNELCNEVKEPQPDRDNRNETCPSSGESNEIYKYPTTGWGSTLLNNEACNVSCQEKLIVNFNSVPYANAGMGFTYPITENGTRICSASYKNEIWQSSMNSAITNAQDQYDIMEANLKKASDLAQACGDKKTFAYTPSCSSPYTDSRWGMTCGCDKCETCWHTCCDTCTYTSCSGSGEEQVCTEHSYTCCSSCNPYSCSGTTGATCPSTPYGVSTSYNSSTDKCQVDVCSKIPTKLWSVAQSEIKSYLSKASSAKTLHDNYVAREKKLRNDRVTCDNWNNNNPYLSNPATSISVNGLDYQDHYDISSNNYTSSDYSYKSARDYTETDYDINYCIYKPLRVSSYSYYLNKYYSVSKFNSTYCKEDPSKIETYRDVWVERSLRDLQYQFSNYYYVQKYTGDLTTSASVANDYGYNAHGYYEYTDFYVKSGLYPFRLNINNLGQNLTTRSKYWSLSLSCNYNVENWIFPPEDDPLNWQYSKVAFMYRQVSLKTPFPNRNPGVNWSIPNALSIFTQYDKKPYYIVLTPELMKSIRVYNETHKYTYYNPNDPYFSEFLRNPIYIGQYNYRDIAGR